MSAASKSPATAETLIALGDEPFEVIAGELVPRAAPAAEHSEAQAALTAVLFSSFHRPIGGPSGPGGWWILTEPDVELTTTNVVRPDVAGWRRDRVPERLVGRPIRVRPDWMCEILSPSNAKHDLVTKMRLYREAQIPHYWLADPVSETLTVHRLTTDGYLVVPSAARGETVRAEPFDAIEFRVGLLFGDDQ